jgi:selenocysteine-specific elongation factor
MRYVILGTAGHIDHGKSYLVKALTGIDPDRLKEEKERGITIDLGFADLKYPDGLTIGIVDVPGHERLIKNMLAGAGGIDLVLLVIAADEGIMPQSKEHLHICNLLRIKSGIIAITKADLVEQDWLELVVDEVRDFVKGTFLEGAEIIPVSSKTGYNLELLKSKIKEAALKIEPKPSGGLFRLPIDRVFTLKGFGTVVTGTAVSGSISVDEPVEILPAKINTRIRGLQSHGKPIQKVYAGQRAAVNLQGVEKEDLKRGDTLVSQGRFSSTDTIDAKVELLPGVPALKTRGLVHLHIGTSETVARVILYGREQLRPSESCYCQFRLQDPTVAQSGDRYIIRRFSPVETIGGGEVLDPSPSRRRKKHGIEDLEVFEHGSLAEKIAMKVKKAALQGMSIARLEGWIKAEISAVRQAVDSLKTEGTVMQFNDTLIHKDSFNSFKNTVLKILEDFHRKNPMKQGIPKEEIRTYLRIEPKVFGSLVSALKEIRAEKDLLRLKDFTVSLSEAEKTKILKILDDRGFQPPTKTELASELSMDEKLVSDILRLMHRDGSAVRINDAMYLSATVYKDMIDRLKKFFARKPEMTVAEFRDLLGTTRKYAVPFLEYLDSNRITLRVGDIRKFLLK